MGARTKKAAKKQKKKPQKRATPAARKIRVWNTDALQTARETLEYTIKDLGEKSGVSMKVVGQIMQGHHKVHYESLEAIVSSLFLKMEEIYNPDVSIRKLTKEVYQRARLNMRINEVEGSITTLKPDGAFVQVWRIDALKAARNALEYTIKDIRKKSGVNEKVVDRIIRGNHKIRYESLEAVVSSLFLKMEEIYNPKAPIAELIEAVYQRARLNRRVHVVEGSVIALKPDSTVIAISGR